MVCPCSNNTYGEHNVAAHCAGRPDQCELCRNECNSHCGDVMERVHSMQAEDYNRQHAANCQQASQTFFVRSCEACGENQCEECANIRKLVADPTVCCSACAARRSQTRQNFQM